MPKADINEEEGVKELHIIDKNLEIKNVFHIVVEMCCTHDGMWCLSSRIRNGIKTRLNRIN